MPVNANPGLNINQIITFSSIQMFFAAKQKAKQYTENLNTKLQNSNQKSTFSC